MTLFDLILEALRAILTKPECRHDLMMALIYLLAVLTVIFWHRRIKLIYGMGFPAYSVSALGAAGPL